MNANIDEAHYPERGITVNEDRREVNRLLETNPNPDDDYEESVCPNCAQSIHSDEEWAVCLEALTEPVEPWSGQEDEPRFQEVQAIRCTVIQPNGDESTVTLLKEMMAADAQGWLWDAVQQEECEKIEATFDDGTTFRWEKT